MAACGIEILTGIADSDIDGAEQLALVDEPISTSRMSDGHGGWNLTIVYKPCADGTDPITKGPASVPASVVNIGTASGDPATFIQSHLADAQAVKAKYGVPIAVTLGQSALETGWGRQVVGNAYFGIKSTGNGQPAVVTATHEYYRGAPVSTVGTFRAYQSFTEAALDYGAFLSSQPRYAGAFAHTDNPDAFAAAIAGAGYATSTTYFADLLAVMKGRNLEAYDRV